MLVKKSTSSPQLKLVVTALLRCPKPEPERTEDQSFFMMSLSLTVESC